jgi:hypothetical protein
MGHRRLWGARPDGRSVDRVRLAVYPAVLILVTVTVAARLGWFGAGSGAAAVRPAQLVVLSGKTSEGRPIFVFVDRKGEIRSLETTLMGVCANGRTYGIGWSPDSPRIPFRRTAAGVVAYEFKTQEDSSGVTSHTYASTTAQMHRSSSITGDASYHAVFRYPGGRQLSCDSGFIHWTAHRPGAANPSSTRSLGAWAGYVWRGRVRSVGASWSVPAVHPGAQLGEAATWIGAQASRPYAAPARDLSNPARAALRWSRLAQRGPFIQVGTIECRGVSPAGRAYDLYDAFWTDATHHFRPIGVFAVKPGDQIAARLSLARRRWTVEIVDATLGKHARLSTADEANASFSLAEWLQENPESPPFGTDEYLYPRLSTVEMRKLAVNDTTPRSADLESQWMSEDGGYLGPSALTDDTFTLEPASLSPAGERFLAIVSRADAALESHASQPASTASRSRVVLSLRAMIGALEGSKWPPRAQDVIRRLIDQTRVLLGRTQAETGVPSSAWLRASRTMSQTARSVRAALGLPEFGRLW